MVRVKVQFEKSLQSGTKLYQRKLNKNAHNSYTRACNVFALNIKFNTFIYDLIAEYLYITLIWP